jgi:2'-5' RNA ligase
VSPGHTIGVALTLGSPAREALEAIRARFEAGPGEMPPHVTLLPPVDIDGDALPAVIDHLAAVGRGTRPFTLVLDGTGSFRPVSPVVFVRVAEGADRCADLEGRVRSGVLSVDARFPYHPHVTIAHDVPDSVLDLAEQEVAGFRAAMTIADLGLYEYVDGRWELLRQVRFSA